MTILVAKPIKVPSGDFCWNNEPPYECCSHFDNEGGHPSCMQDLGILAYEESGSVRKCLSCRNLKVIK